MNICSVLFVSHDSIKYLRLASCSGAILDEWEAAWIIWDHDTLVYLRLWGRGSLRLLFRIQRAEISGQVPGNMNWKRVNKEQVKLRNLLSRLGMCSSLRGLANVSRSGSFNSPGWSASGIQAMRCIPIKCDRRMFPSKMLIKWSDMQMIIMIV